MSVPVSNCYICHVILVGSKDYMYGESSYKLWSEVADFTRTKIWFCDNRMQSLTQILHHTRSI